MRVAGAAALVWLAVTGGAWLWGDWRFRASDEGPILVRERNDERTTWSLVFDRNRLGAIQIASSRIDRRGRELWRDADSLRLCVAHPENGVRVANLTVQTLRGTRTITIDGVGC